MPDNHCSRKPGSGARHRGGNGGRGNSDRRGNRRSAEKAPVALLPLPLLLVLIEGKPQQSTIEGYTADIVCSMANTIDLTSDLKSLLFNMNLGHLFTNDLMSFVTYTRNAFTAGTQQESSFWGFADSKIINEKRLRSTILQVKFLLAFHRANPTYYNTTSQNGYFVARYAAQLKTILDIIRENNSTFASFNKLIAPSTLADF